MTNILWGIQLRVWTKLALGGLFSLTVMVIVFSILRAAVASDHKKPDLSWLVLWHGLELSIGSSSAVTYC
jgi:hypothetical protein